MARTLNAFIDILENRRREDSNFLWIFRKLKTTVAYKHFPKPTPAWHKEEVLNSLRIQDTIQYICQKENISKEQAEELIWSILDEIGFNKRLCVIRWLGLILTKICTQVCRGIYVNEESILRVKRKMGNIPVIFLPSHRSYADFILMSYICFTYDLEIPSIAAGMDFHAMWGMGTVLRDTGAFFMRRSYSNDNLYWIVFRQYIHQLITKGDLPLEFFIEGTRSRTAKSLVPKFGLLSMVLKTLFTSEVPDILFVPINISYDRVMEEKLFTYELLGVPKPKESTSGFFKSLSIIQENYGDIYVDFADPISAKDYFSTELDRSVHSMKPPYLQELTQQEKDLVASFAYDLVRIQQKHSVVTVFNLVAVGITHALLTQNHVILLDSIMEDVENLNALIKTFGAITNIKELDIDIENALQAHKNLIYITPNKTIELVNNSIGLEMIDTGKLKGHAFSRQTMSVVVPYIMLQIYVNPVLHYLICPALLVIVLRHHQQLSKGNLFSDWSFLRNLFSNEFVTIEKWNQLDFEETLKHLSYLEIIDYADFKYHLTKKCEFFEGLLCSILKPFMLTYYVVLKMLNANPHVQKERSIVNMTQAQLEELISNSKPFIHPYCLNLNTIVNCLENLAGISAITKIKLNEDTAYEINSQAIHLLVEKLEPYVDLESFSPDLHIKINLESKL